MESGNSPSDDRRLETALGGETEQSGTIGLGKRHRHATHTLTEEVGAGLLIIVGVDGIIHRHVDKRVGNPLASQRIADLDPPPSFEAELVADERSRETSLIEVTFARQIVNEPIGIILGKSPTEDLLPDIVGATLALATECRCLI